MNASFSPIEPQNSMTQINAQFEERAAQATAKKWNLPFIDMAKTPINPEILRLLPKNQSEAARAILFFRSGYFLKMAVVSPENPEIKKIIETFRSQNFEIEIFVCTESEYKKAFSEYESKFINLKHVELQSGYSESDAKSSTWLATDDFKNLNEHLKTLKSAEALNEIEILAVKVGASDIHLQPYENKALLRFRLNGILHDICDISREKAEKLVARIKYDGGMKSNIFNIPQDGHISFSVNNRQIELRISTLPTEFFESVVMRVLDSRRGIKDFLELGFEKKTEISIRELLQHKNGMILITGPTGSGKTTTLYAMLSELNSPEKKLITLEDPVEYHLDNVTQSPVNENSEYNFANGLKAMLRHDPDVVLIGEIREFSTAKLATEAALTGHIVLSSLHTNSAVGAITRLHNLGLENFNISSAINAVFAQRLVRKICPYCAQKTVLDLSLNPKIREITEKIYRIFPEEMLKIKPQNKKMSSVECLKSKGCERCSRTGFIGQTVICEHIIFTPKIREKISNGAHELELEVLIREENPYFLSLFEDGIRKMLLKQTTLDEVYRVAG